jgi:hypothetical protein
MNQEIATYINKIDQTWQAEVCTRLDQIIQQSIPDVQERIQYGKPHYLKNGKYACVLGTARAWVSLTIFNAAALEAPEGLFEAGDSPDRKTIKVRNGQTVDYELLAGLLQQAARSL